MRTPFAIGVFLLAGLAAFPAGAQDYANPYQQNLYALSRELGALHFLRGQCERGERTVWRDSMKELIRQENPSRRQAQIMTEHFNDGYKEARDRFPECSPESEDEARTHAGEAVRLTQVLAQTLE